MHVVIGILTGLISILYLLDRMGIDLGGLNPFYWRRRRAWAKKYQGDPIYSIEDPVHLAAVFIVGVAKLDGDLTSDSKKAALKLFREKFSLDTGGASELLGSAAHLLGSPQVIDTQLAGLMDKNRERFTKEQAESMIQMAIDVSSAGGSLGAKQRECIAKMQEQLVPADKTSTSWS